MEVKSAKGRKSGGTGGSIGGGGETQLEIERRKLGDREAKIFKELEDINRRSQHEKTKKENTHSTIPLIALVSFLMMIKTHNRCIDRVH